MPTMSKNPIQGFSLGDERVSSNSPHVPSPPGRHWITLNRILHGMKGEKDVQPWWFFLTKAHTGKWRTWNTREEREIVRERAFMILITKIHNPPSLLFWLRRTFPRRDNNQKKKKEMQKQKERGEIIEDNWGKQNLLLDVVYSRTSFASSLLILIVSESILETFFTEQETLFFQIHCKSHGFCRTPLPTAVL